MRGRRSGWRPGAVDRARLAGRSPQETPNYRLAAELRRINSYIAQLSPESQRDLAGRVVEAMGSAATPARRRKARPRGPLLSH
jgi:hypothetical protein